MTTYTTEELLCAYCKEHGTWGINLSIRGTWDAVPFEEWWTPHTGTTPPTLRAAPWLSYEDAEMLFVFHSCVVVFESRREMEEAYWATVGDDGPRAQWIEGVATNTYDGPARIYALTVNEKGEVENENT